MWSLVFTIWTLLTSCSLFYISINQRIHQRCLNSLDLFHQQCFSWTKILQWYYFKAGDLVTESVRFLNIQLLYSCQVLFQRCVYVNVCVCFDYDIHYNSFWFLLVKIFHKQTFSMGLPPHIISTWLSSRTSMDKVDVHRFSWLKCVWKVNVHSFWLKCVKKKVDVHTFLDSNVLKMWMCTHLRWLTCV